MSISSDFGRITFSLSIECRGGSRRNNGIPVPTEGFLIVSLLIIEPFKNFPVLGCVWLLVEGQGASVHQKLCELEGQTLAQIHQCYVLLLLEYEPIVVYSTLRGRKGKERKG